MGEYNCNSMSEAGHSFLSACQGLDEASVRCLDFCMLFLNILCLLFLGILNLSNGGFCTGGGFGPCDGDKILHGPSTVQATYYLFIYWLYCQIISRLLMNHMPDWKGVKASFAAQWIFFWWFTPVMYVTVLAMVYSEIEYWTEIGGDGSHGVAYTWIVLLNITTLAQCAKFWWLNTLVAGGFGSYTEKMSVSPQDGEGYEAVQRHQV